jgi:hypothetical protein
MITPFFNWPSAILTPRVVGETPLSGSASTREDIFSWENSILKIQSKTAGNEEVLGFYSNEKSTGKEQNPLVKAYGKSLPDDDIRSIMGRAIPPEWTVNLLALVKEPWKFKYVDDQFATYRQQCQQCQHCQPDQQSQIMLKIAVKLPGKSKDDKRKNNERHNHNNGRGRSGGKYWPRGSRKRTRRQ